MAELIKYEGDQFNNLTFETVVFHGDELAAVRVGKVVYVPIRRICEKLGIDYSTQLRKLRLNPVATVGIIPTVAPDGKVRDLAVVDLGQLPLWLAGISPTKVHPDKREKLLRYQVECKAVLASHFFGEDFEVVRTHAANVPEVLPEVVIDVTPTLPAVPDLNYLAEQTEGAVKIAKVLFFLDGNEASIKANQLMKKYHKVDFLEAAGMQALPAPVQEAQLNVTEIGKRIGLARNDVNPFLIKHGFQTKVDNGHPPYQPTNKGLPFAHMVNWDLSKPDGSNMNSVPQLRWYSSIVPVLQAILATPAAA